MAQAQAQLDESNQILCAELHEKALAAINDALGHEEVSVRLRAAALVIPRGGQQIQVNASATASSTATPELDVDELLRQSVALPATLRRGIACGVVDAADLRKALEENARLLAALDPSVRSEDDPRLPLPKLPSRVFSEA